MRLMAKEEDIYKLMDVRDRYLTGGSGGFRLSPDAADFLLGLPVLYRRIWDRHDHLSPSGMENGQAGDGRRVLLSGA